MRSTRDSRIASAQNQDAKSIDTETETDPTYADIAAADEAKEELREIIAFLREPTRGSRLGGRMPKAVVLVGPPGTGKTLLARATAGEAKVPFLPINAAELVERFIEGRASAMGDLFEEARRQAPAILFIDDLDRVGGCQDTSPAAGGLKERAVNRLLIELDRLDSGAGVAVLAATNRPDILDPALLRAGRFEAVPVPCPDKAGRARILHLHTRVIRMSEDVDLTALAASTPGFTGADLARLVNKAALLATRRGADAVTPADFSDAIDRILGGVGMKALVLSAHEREVLACHKVGHALLGLSLPSWNPVHALSMVPRNAATVSCSMHWLTEARVLLTHQELENEMAILLAGRAAEHLIFGEFSTLGTTDLQRASVIARGIAARYGMTAELGQVSYGEMMLADSAATGPGSEPRYSEETAREIDCVVRSLIGRAFSRAVELLRAQRDVLEKGARLLARHQILDVAELSALRQRHWSQGKEKHDDA